MNKAAFLLLMILLPSGAALAQMATADMVLLPTGPYQPFLNRNKTEIQIIPGFWLDRTPVSNGQFRAFTDRNPQWGPAAIPAVFADSHYLHQWSASRPQDDQRPVTHVSWFAAMAYCQSQGKTLPSTDQWEYALDDLGRNRTALRDQILAWYAVPNRADLPMAADGAVNGFGVAGLVGLVWEWTLDFNAAMAGPEFRAGNDPNKDLFCGGGSLGARDAADYAAFTRFAFRSSLQAAYTTANLGFRCAKEISP